MNNKLAAGRLDDTLAVLRATGADTDAFLQGQLSSDLRKLAAGNGQLSSFNSPKGRMLAVLTLTRSDTGADLELPRSIADAVARRLRMFVLRAKVQLADSGDAVLGLVGQDTPQALADAGLPVPATPLAFALADGLRVMRRFGELPRFTLHGPAERLDALSQAWAAAPLSSGDWALADVLAGVPVALPQTQDHFVAQMANLDQLGGIAFDKGCYTGQEIVARLHYLGQLKRRMYLCKGQGAAPEPGSPVHEAEGGQAVGEIVLAAAHPDGGYSASAVLQISHAGSAQLRVGDQPLSVPQVYAYARPAAALTPE